MRKAKNMIRSRGSSAGGNLPSGIGGIGDGKIGGGLPTTVNAFRKLSENNKIRPAAFFKISAGHLRLVMAFLLGVVVQNFFHALHFDASSSKHPPSPSSTTGTSTSDRQLAMSSFHPGLSSEFDGMIRRAMLHRQHCERIGLADPVDHTGENNHTAHLPQYGILEAVKNYKDPGKDYPYQCQLPPENECGETQFTVLFMAYNPDRLQKMRNQIMKFVADSKFAPLVAEVLIVWNGDRQVEETPMGKALVDLTQKYPIRISYPLKAGFENDLMNRYHPRLDVKTKAIMYYDDDGPFYSYAATLGGFELWKRNSNAQIGAMARKLDLGPRQRAEKKATLNGPGDRYFVSQCPTDNVRYNFNEFANFGARMVLPSGSFLHSNYLCFLWHPLFEEIRDYVRSHPVKPDDGTVSTIVSHLAGRAPKVYPRRVNEPKNDQRRLSMVMDDPENHYNTHSNDGDDDVHVHHDNNNMTKTTTTTTMRRRLMHGIDWDSGGNHDKKHLWGNLRGDAANSLIRYFGSINSGSIGWCYGTPFQQGEYCKPEFPVMGQLPWMTPDHKALDTCP